MGVKMVSKTGMMTMMAFTMIMMVVTLERCLGFQVIKQTMIPMDVEI